MTVLVAEYAAYLLALSAGGILTDRAARHPTARVASVAAPVAASTVWAAPIAPNTTNVERQARLLLGATGGAVRNPARRVSRQRRTGDLGDR
ncbi:hypothetical protein [Actinomadura harenae]|uniref:hypothetical protein n=1 Tax=Actinomadura harenae TaxID=2483351 RepID=UPI0011C419EC|nr:hypothetical protein [Actinomadura harenae]